MNLIDYISDNFAVSISLIALTSTIISPLLTAIINGGVSLLLRALDHKHERKLREQQYYTQHRADVIEQYISAAGKAARVRNAEAKAEFGAVMGEIYLYIDETAWPLLAEIEQNILYSDREGSTEALTKLCKELSRDGVRNTNSSKTKSRKARRSRKSDKSKRQK